jgi:hypothetical protein
MKLILKTLNTTIFISFLCMFSVSADFYAGIGAGYSTGKAKTDQVFAPGFSFNKSLSVTGATGQVFWSWEEFPFEDALWGIELSADTNMRLNFEY